MTIPYQITLGEPCNEEEVKGIITATFAEIDGSVNNWNPFSEVSALNRLAPGERMELSPELAHFLEAVGEVVAETGGLFDPTIGKVQRLWRERLEGGCCPTQEELEALRDSVGWERLHIEGLTAWKEGPIELDLGGIAKGYAVDLIAERLSAAGYTRYLVCWGGELRGEGRPWKIATPDGRLILESGALATSGDSEQYWETAEGTYTHICHPQTLQAIKVECVGRSTSARAPTCLRADGLATATYLNP
ncbi:MAG: FAD:protein FMN transferase [Parachlamydiales bacterium]